MALAKPAFTVIAAWLVAAAAQAQQSPMPEEIAWKLLELGRVIDPPKTAALFAPLQQKEPYSGVKVERDVKYGPADRNRLDIFVPETPSAPRPVLIFVHGGAFTAGDKRGPNNSPFYDNIVLWAAKNGLVGVNMTYRLAPQSTWPAAAEDVAAAVEWVSTNIASHGGDPARVYLMGHSAGAVHVASYVSHPEFYKAKGGGLAGAILVSGIYDLTAAPAGEPEKAYFGADPARYAQASSLAGLKATSTPLMVTASELDPPRFVAEFWTLKEATCARPAGCARAILLPQHSHMSEVYSINTADDRLTSQVLEFVKTGK
jgi:triacylglycerol lipase